MSDRARHTFNRYGGWLPENHFIAKSFIAKHGVGPHDGRDLSGAIKQFKDFIDSDPEVYDLMLQAFIQSDESNPVRDFGVFYNCLDHIVQTAPSFHTAEDPNGQEVTEPIGIPMYLVFDLLSNTSAGYDLLRMERFNSSLKTLLASWNEFLGSENSNVVLNTTKEGWFSEAALALLEEGRGGSFNDIYVVPDPDAENRGFKSWDEFFTREIKKDMRPIDPKDKIWHISNTCESTTVRISHGVQKNDKFWLKGQAYSLYDIFARNDEDVDRFVGGTVYQAFLGPLDYHRWHSPVDGVIVKTLLLDGTYYAALPDEGALQSDGTYDPRGALLRSQPFLSLSAARALIFIQPDNTHIDTLCFIGVGMAEVSTCEIKVEQGQRVAAGDELGMFHFGGSTHCLIFGPQTVIKFLENVQPENHIWVNATIANILQPL